MALRWWTAPQARWVRSREETSSSRRKRKFPAPGTRQQRWHRLAAAYAERMNPRSGRPRMNLGLSHSVDVRHQTSSRPGREAVTLSRLVICVIVCAMCELPSSPTTLPLPSPPSIHHRVPTRRQRHWTVR
uniref:Uncharacterized protein n=1 Tax=Anopheles merus TaxID=30066 RepID=A0A182VC30_ANOME